MTNGRYCLSHLNQGLYLGNGHILDQLLFQYLLFCNTAFTKTFNIIRTALLLSPFTRFIMNNIYLNQFKSNRSKNFLEISCKAVYGTEGHRTASEYSFSQLVSNQGSTIRNKTRLLIITNAYQKWRPSKWKKYKDEVQQIVMWQTTLHGLHRKPKFYTSVQRICVQCGEGLVNTIHL